MNYLQEVDIGCPYCAETITILVDGSVEQQSYIEDCQVCCRPIVIQLDISSAGDVHVQARHEDEV